MNLTELKAAVASEADITKDVADKTVKAVFSVISKTLADGDSICIRAFGAFSVSDSAARTGRNPNTGAEIQIPAAKVAKFKVGKGLKDAVNVTKKSDKKKNKKK
jgi:DNA-binding protein HU-beta